MHGATTNQLVNYTYTSSAMTIKHVKVTINCILCLNVSGERVLLDSQ